MPITQADVREYKRLAKERKRLLAIGVTSDKLEKPINPLRISK